ncbi:MAG: asparagine synthase (glutamine-hydrolyzing) [Acidobacteriota bacterium]|nr:asparagine synthase (glutamine-hydrolyzing) [Acidobacteriota bacterium]
MWEATLGLAHRGPDQQSVFQSEAISLGAVRLKVIDLEAGDQPFRSEDGNTVLVFNGEVYNNTELREELCSRGRKFRSRCDTETVLQAFLEWDLDCLSKLRGMFAFAIWSERDRRLVLARDRMGIKPLYFYRAGREIYFGSELKALFAHPEIERRLDPEGLHYFTSLNYVPSPHTLVEGIKKVPPGHWMQWRNGEVTSAPYWKLSFQPQSSLSLDAAAEQLDGLLQQSVKEHLTADVPLGLWLSGGLDSTALLHYASQLSSSRLKTFSISFQGRKFDDGQYAQTVAETYGTEHHAFDLNESVDLVSAIEEMAFYSDEPGADAGALPVWFLSRMSREHVTVALSGDGADELFGGYLTYLADSYAGPLRRLPGFARQAALRLARAWPVSDEKIGLDYKVQRMLQGSLLSAGDAHFFWNGTFSENEKKKLHLRNGHPPVASLLDTLPEQSRKVGRLNQFIWLDQTYYLPDNILYKCDRMSMAHALEVRVPYLDHRLAEFAASLPESLKVSGAGLKVVLRHLMASKLPREVIKRPKQGFDIPAHDWFRNALRPLLLDTLTRTAVEESGLFHWKTVEKLIDDHMERRANLGYHLWGLLTLFLWMKRWGIQAAPRVHQANQVTHAVSVTS